MHHVLLIEDEQNQRELAKMHFAKQDEFSLDIAINYESFLEFDQSNKYDLYILDYVFPGSEGLQLIKEIRAKDENTPIIMLSGKSESYDKELALMHGANLYITKPVKYSYLFEQMKTLLSEKTAAK